MMYTVTVPVSGELITAITPYRQRYDSQAALIPPHLEMLPAFQFSGQLEALTRHLDNICEEHAPIKVTVVSWDILEQQGYQLRLPVMAGSLELTALYSHLLTGPLAFLAKQDCEYQPHLIFGRFEQRAEADGAKETLKGFEPKFTFRADRLELYQRTEPGQTWRSIKQFGLKGTVAGRLRRPVTYT